MALRELLAAAATITIVTVLAAEAQPAPDRSSETVDRPAIEAARSALTRRDYGAALEILREAARRGDVEAQYRLAVMVRQGIGIEPDASTAFTWMMTAASGGHVDARYSLGNMYERGEGVDASRSEAMRWYIAAAAQGHALAATKLRTTDTQPASGSPPTASALLEAAARGRGDAALEMLRAGLDPDSAEGGRTALGEAAANDRTNIIRLLIDNGADVDHVDANGDAPLLLAA
ncbi:MAG: hypothetical protein E4H03_12710, partial [Myxococcales bacterium]